MADELTHNYDLYCPKPSDSMAEVGRFLTDNLTKLEAAANPPQVTGALPQTGNFKVGDRVYRTDDQSNYLYMGTSDGWPYIWRPIQAAVSPWIEMPMDALYLGSILEQYPAQPLSFALDNKGHCHWKGALQVVAGQTLLHADIRYDMQELPPGLRRPSGGSFVLAVDPATPMDTVGVGGCRMGRWDHDPSDYVPAWTFYNAQSATTVWWTGISYATGELTFNEA